MSRPADGFCPICGKATGQKRFAPFCSSRCADLDLGRWLKGSYVIPGPPSEEADSAPQPSEPPDDA